MCGLFGFVANNNQRLDMKRLQRIAQVTESRGPHAFGFAWIDAVGRLKMFKQSGRISDHLAVLAMARDARMLVGHCRFATHGDPRNNLNNHPHPCDGGWLVHNGVIGDYRELIDEYDLAPVTQCDSEVLAQLIERLDGSLVDRAIGAVQIAGGSPLAMLALWRNPQRLIAVRSGSQPLHVGESREGSYLASLSDGLPGKPWMIHNHRALAFSFRGGATKMVGFNTQECVLR